MSRMPDPAQTRRQLDVIRYVALADFLLLIALLYASVIADSDGAVSILGPIHGIGFIAQVYLVVKGAGEGRWGWWFPAIVVVTAGPPGALYGDWKLRRELASTGA